MLILGLETSCDETAAAVVADGWQVRSNITATQHDLHAMYGGVVPEIASRAHLEKIQPVIEQALAQAQVRLADLDAIAVGNRPGLIGSLIIGVSAAQALALALHKPLIGVDHVRAHLHAAFLRDHDQLAPPWLRPPDAALGLVVSGGHTSLYTMTQEACHLLGRTIDDAAGEAFDKAAALLNLGYPGGPALDHAAMHGNPDAHDFPRSMLGPESLDFSFSGLKTSLLYAVRGQPVTRDGQVCFERTAEALGHEQRADFAAAFQTAVVDVIIRKIKRALQRAEQAGEAVRDLIVGGGVSANSLLRRELAQLAAAQHLRLHLPAMDWCVDNAAMIAGMACLQQHENPTLAGACDLPVIATTAM